MIGVGVKLRRRFLLILAVLMAVPAVAGAQVASNVQSATSASALTPAPDESPVVQELLVVGRRPGPALWRVTRGESEVVILGGLSPIPHLQQWDQARVQHALQGSTVLFLPPNKLHVGLLDAAIFLFRQGALRPAHGADMETMLPPALRTRFERVRDSLHLDPKRYRRWKPGVAGAFLLADAMRASGFSVDKPQTTVARLARAAHTEVRTVGDIKARPVFDAVARMSDAQHVACLGAALDDVERETVHARPAAAAWAVGDLKGVRANTGPSALEGCLLQLPNIRALEDQGTRDAVRTIQGALNRPGRSVAVIDLSFLLRRDGVLDQLKAQGAQVTVPME